MGIRERKICLLLAQIIISPNPNIIGLEFYPNFFLKTLQYLDTSDVITHFHQASPQLQEL